MKNPSLYRPISTRSKRRGFTLAEMAIALGIIGIVIAAIWVAAGSVNLNNQVNQAAQEMQTVSQNMLSLYQGRTWPPAAGCSGVATDITSTVISASVIPSTYVVNGACASATQVFSAGGGTFTVFANAAGAPAGMNSTFRISFSNVPLQGCVALLMQGTACDPSQPGCPVQVLAGANTKLPGASSAGGWQATLTPAAATTFCNLNGAAGSVSFDFKL